MFNTLSYTKKLEQAGVSREQAEAHVQIIAEIVEGDLSTKQDIKDLKDEMQKMEYRIVIKLGALAAGLAALLVTVMTGILKIFFN
jgi:hypothetical protein